MGNREHADAEVRNANQLDVYQRLLVAQRHHRIDLGRTTRRQQTCEHRETDWHDGGGDERGWIGRRDAKYKLGNGLS